MCDISDYVIGAALGQCFNKIFHTIDYAIKTLNESQVNYNTTEKELLAIVYAIDKFRSYLMDTKVVVHTDHLALKYLLQKKDAKRKLIRLVLLLQKFDLIIRDNRDFENVLDDYLSRLVNKENEVNSLPIQESLLDE